MVKKTTKDTNPQFFNMKITESAANTFTTLPYSTPVVNQLSGGKALVMELLRIFIINSNPEPIAATATSVTVMITKKVQTAILGLEHPDVVALRIQTCHCVGARTAEQTANVFFEKLMTIELGDGMGNGYLFGNKEMHLSIQGTSNAAAKTSQVKVLYRLKEVDATELIGIIQE